MSNYSQSTFFGPKDSLLHGDTLKIARGTQIDTELGLIATAIASKLDSTGYTAADILSKLITVDGTGSGLDADLLDGNDSAYYRNVGNVNAGTLAIANGGTAASTASAARTSLGLVIGTDVLAPTGSGTGLTGVLKTANNLSDVTASTARTNLGVTATGADTTYCFRSNNLSDVTASTARSNLGLSNLATTNANAAETRNISGKSGTTKTLSSSAASGGSDGDIWYQY